MGLSIWCSYIALRWCILSDMGIEGKSRHQKVKYSGSKGHEDLVVASSINETPPWVSTMESRSGNTLPKGPHNMPAASSNANQAGSHASLRLRCPSSKSTMATWAEGGACARWGPVMLIFRASKCCTKESLFTTQVCRHSNSWERPYSVSPILCCGKR
jgi:hypothetical protein